MTGFSPAVDPDRAKIERDTQGELCQKKISEGFITIRRKTIAQVSASEAVLEKQEACDYLERLISVTVTQISIDHEAYGSLRWLWYLRRTSPRIFRGSFDTTAAYDMALAEAMSWFQSTAHDRSLSPNQAKFPWGDSSLRHLCRFIGKIKYLSDLHRLYRRVGKGGVLRIDRDSIEVDNTAKQENAILIYDARQDRSVDLGSPGDVIGDRLGVTFSDLQSIRNESPINSSANWEYIFFLFRSKSKHALELPVVVGEKIRKAQVQTEYLPSYLGIERIFFPYGSEAEHDWDSLQRVASLIQLLAAVPVFQLHHPAHLTTMMTNGYLFISEKDLRVVFEQTLVSQKEIFDSLAPSVSWFTEFDSFFDHLCQFQPKVWPLRMGGVVRRYSNGGRQVLIDVAAATQALVHGMEVDTSDVYGNPRGDAFELQVQSVLDDSKWAPDDRYSSLRGVHLRRGGKVLTDVDALGKDGDDLLLVSCKSRVYTAEYEKGVYNEVRNHQSLVDDAVRDWKKKRDYFLRNPVGDNYDFSAFRNIVGLVCTPFVIFTDDEQSLDYVADGLRACSSIHELKRWAGKTGNGN